MTTGIDITRSAFLAAARILGLALLAIGALPYAAALLSWFAFLPALGVSSVGNWAILAVVLSTAYAYGAVQVFRVLAPWRCTATETPVSRLTFSRVLLVAVVCTVFWWAQTDRPEFSTWLIFSPVPSVVLAAAILGSSASAVRENDHG